MYWINERCYKTLEDALMAYEEYKKNERILNGEGLSNKITTWGTLSQINTRTLTYADFGPPRISGAKIGTFYFDKYTNKMWMLNSEKKWVHMASYGEYKTTAAKDKKNTTNCRNCGAPIRSRICEYCGTAY